jgi:hypothetical protein
LTYLRVNGRLIDFNDEHFEKQESSSDLSDDGR